MAEEHVGCSCCSEAGNLGVAYTAMSNGLAASSNRMIGQFDQTAANMAASWGIYTQSPSQMTANAQRTTEESGSGATRAFSNPSEGNEAP